MTEINSKCPKCGEGIMTLMTNTSQLPQAGLSPQGRVRCALCGFEDTAAARGKE
jgi:hypothetical protein